MIRIEDCNEEKNWGSGKRMKLYVGSLRLFSAPLPISGLSFLAFQGQMFAGRGPPTAVLALQIVALFHTSACVAPQ